MYVCVISVHSSAPDFQNYDYDRLRLHLFFDKYNTGTMQSPLAFDQGDPAAWIRAHDELMQPQKQQRLTQSHVLVDLRLGSSLHGAPKTSHRPAKLPEIKPAISPSRSRAHSPSQSVRSPDTMEFGSRMSSPPRSPSGPLRDRNGYILPFEPDPLDMVIDEDVVDLVQLDEKGKHVPKRPASSASRLHHTPSTPSRAVQPSPASPLSWQSGWPFGDNHHGAKRNPRSRFDATGWRVRSDEPPAFKRRAGTAQPIPSRHYQIPSRQEEPLRVGDRPGTAPVYVPQPYFGIGFGSAVRFHSFNF